MNSIDALKLRLERCFQQPLQGHDTNRATPGLAKSIEEQLLWFIGQESKRYRSANNGRLMKDVGCR